MQKPLRLMFIFLVILFIVPNGIRAEEAVNPASDIIPPEVILISPQPDSVVETNTPLIEIMISDSGSGIKLDTVRFYLDDINRTDHAIIEDSDVTGQAETHELKISYLPSQPLPRGVRRILVIVRDRADNLTEQEWNFEVKGRPDSGFQVSGVNTLRVEQYPISKILDYFEFTLQGQMTDTRIRLNLEGHFTDYPSGTADYSYKNYNFFKDRYMMGLNYRDTELLFGYVFAPINSELIQIGSEVKGGVLNQSFSNKTGRYDLSLFTGEAAHSAGLRIDVYDYSGFISRWDAPFEMQLSSFYLQLGDDHGYRYSGIKGNKVFSRLLTQFEAVHGSSDITESSGNALSFRMDYPLGPVDLGFDYQLLQPDYPSVLAPSSLPLGGGGTQRYILRGNIRLGSKQRLRIQGAFSEDNLDSVFVQTNYRQNYHLDYSLRTDADLDWNLSYYGDRRQRKGGLVHDYSERNDSLTLSFHKDFFASTLRSSLSWGENIYSYKPDQSSERFRYLGSWTIPYTKFNLTPSVQWLVENKANNADLDSKEVRLTADFYLSPRVGRSKVAIFHYVSDETSHGREVEKNITGLETAIYWSFCDHSTLSFVYNHSLWDKEDNKSSSGNDCTLWLEWKMIF